MTDHELGEHLKRLGVTPSTYRALPLLPLVQVAWADGQIQDAERDLILRLAETRYRLEGEGREVLRSWLDRPPSATYAARGRRVLIELVQRSAIGQIRREDLGDVVSLAKDVARAAGGFFGFGAINANEAHAIEEIARALDIPAERRWASEFDETMVPEDADRENEGPPIEVVFPGEDGAQPAPPPPSAASLMLYDEFRGDRSCPIVPPGLTIGRGRDNTVRISYDGQVSRDHCRLSVRGDRYFVTDLHSVSGTWVNGERIVERELLGGEEIAVGATVFFFQGR